MGIPIDDVYDVCVAFGMPALHSNTDRISADTKAARIVKFLHMKLPQAKSWDKLIKELPPSFLLRMSDTNDMVKTLGKLQLEEELS